MEGGRRLTSIPDSASERITLTYAFVNRRGQITAGGYDNDEPLTHCASPLRIAPHTGGQVVVWASCHNTHMYVLTPVGH